jgi:hypothetical protein
MRTRQYDSVRADFSVSSASVRALSDERRLAFWTHVLGGKRLVVAQGWAVGVYARGCGLPFRWLYETVGRATVSGPSAAGLVM